MLSEKHKLVQVLYVHTRVLERWRNVENKMFTQKHYMCRNINAIVVKNEWVSKPGERGMGCYSISLPQQK